MDKGTTRPRITDTAQAIGKTGQHESPVLVRKELCVILHGEIELIHEARSRLLIRIFPGEFAHQRDGYGKPMRIKIPVTYDGVPPKAE